MVKINIGTYMSFVGDYLNGKFPNERMGQAFLNKYFPGITDPSLYYETNVTKFHDMIFKSYIDI